MSYMIALVLPLALGFAIWIIAVMIIAAIGAMVEILDMGNE